MKKLYLTAPFITAFLVAVFLSMLHESALYSSDKAAHVVNQTKQWIPMIEGLKSAANYSDFTGFAHSVFWIFIPFCFWCGWQLIKHSSESAKLSFLNKSIFVRSSIYILVGLAAMAAYTFALPTQHRGGGEDYVYNGLIGLTVDFSLQAFVYWILGFIVRYGLIEESILSKSKEKKNG